MEVKHKLKYINKLSKLLVKTLRHTAMRDGFDLSRQGFVNIKELLNHARFKQYTQYAVCKAVNLDDQRRLTLRYDENNQPEAIRAEKGHSMQYVHITYPEAVKSSIKDLVHVTSLRNWELIREDKIRPMKRNEIHLRDCLTSRPASADDVVIYLSPDLCENEGITLLRAGNGVILSRDDIPLTCVTRVTRGNGNLVNFTLPQKATPSVTVQLNSHSSEGPTALFLWGRLGSTLVDTLMLIDTGAEMSFIPERVFNRIPQDDTTTLRHTDERVQVGNGSFLELAGRAEVNVRVGDRDYPHEFLISKCESACSIIGLDFSEALRSCA